MSGEMLDLRDAAEQLGVHYQTAYKWVRSGELPAVLIRGAYRLSDDDLARFAAARERPEPPRPVWPRAGGEALARRLYDQLVAGREREAAELIGSLARGGSLTGVARDLIVPTLRRIGEEWRAGRLDIASEHRASTIVERILAAHYPNPRGRRRGTAAVAALSGDRHALPTMLAAIALREDNWRVHHLGVDLPPEELAGFCRSEAVDLVVLSVTVAGRRRAAERASAQLESLGVRTLVGAPGRSLDELRELARGRQQ